MPPIKSGFCRVVVGLGKSGMSCVRYLADQCQVVVVDSRPPRQDWRSSVETTLKLLFF